MRVSGICALAVLFCGALVVASISASRDNNALEPSAALSKVSFSTDGVLDGRWLAKTLDVREGMSMTAVDVSGIRSKLEGVGQIRSASVTLRMPNELVVRVMERTPVMRVNARMSSAKVMTLLIDAEGCVFEGANYPANSLRMLPYVDGISLKRKGNGFEPLEGMQPVADLLNVARQGWPRFYRDWRVVSLAHYQGADNLKSVVEISSRSLGRLVFSIKDPEDQLRRLQKVLASGATRDPRPIVGVNLSIPDRATVDYADK